MNVKSFSTFVYLSACYTIALGVDNANKLSIDKAPSAALIVGHSLSDGAKMYHSGAIISEWLVLTHGMHQA